MPVRVFAAALIAMAAAGLSAQQPVVTLPQQRPPVFRAGAHYVRVDAYPTGKDGRIVEGLTKDDFEIFEDGAPQAIESAEYITFDTWTPDAERKDPRSLEDAYDLAADPTWRVFVIVIDRAAYGFDGQHYIRGPLHQFLERNLGPRDLFGLLTTENEWTDLTLGQKTTVANAILDSREWLESEPYDECGPVNGRKKLDATYSLLEGLVNLLGLVREEKKSIVFVSYGLDTPKPMPVSQSARMPFGIPGVPGLPGTPGPPGPTGPRLRPPTGGRGGGPAGPGDRIATPSVKANCQAEEQRVANIDFERRFHDLLRDARHANVAFYPISPAGLQTIPIQRPRPGMAVTGNGFDEAAYRLIKDRNDSLLSLANETGGIAIVNTNDLAGGMRRIANDLQSYYVLGYYTTNTKWDGGLRQIKVKRKPRDSVTSRKPREIRARRQYRAPTAEEMALITRLPSRPESESAAPRLPPTLVGEPVAYRVAPKQAPQKVSSFQFDRTERLRVEWPVLRTLDRREVRLLDRTGKPLPVDLPVSEDEAARVIVVELALAPFARGEYTIELTAGAGDTSERRKVAFVMR